MSYDIGPRIGIEGEKQFKEVLSELNSRLKAFGSELKATSSAFDRMDKSEENLTKQNEVLGKSIQAQREKMALLSTQLDKQKAKLTELGAALEATRAREDASAAEVRAAETAYLRQSNAVNNLTAQLNRTSTELNGLEHNLSENTAELARAEAANSELAQAERAAEEAAEQLRQEQVRLSSELAQSSEKLQRSSEALGEVNKVAMLAAAALAGLALASGKVGADFEEQMSKVEAISGASAEEMGALTNAAKEMGATTKFSATESGQALEYMAMAGWKSEQMIDGLPGIMNLAAASGEELGLVSDIVTDALTGFGLQAADSAHFADVLAQASAASNTNVAMMGETFKYAAPVAGALGYSVEDVAVAVGLMANAGIKGEMAGTALRGMLTNLAKPSNRMIKYMDDLGISLTDAAGEVKPLSVQLVDLREKFSTLSEAQQAEYAAGIAGKEAMSGLLALVNASDADFDKLTNSIANASGTAKEMAKTMNDNLKGQLTLLKSAAEGVGIAFYEKFGQQASAAVEKLGKSVGKFSQDLESGALDTELKLLASAAVAGGIALLSLNAALALKDLKNFHTAFKLGGEALNSFRGATIATTIAQNALNLAQSLSPLGWVAIAATAAAAAFVTYRAMSGGASTTTSELDATIKELNETLEEQTGTQKELADARGEAFAGIEEETSRVGRCIDELDRLTDANGRVTDADKTRADMLANQINTLIPGTVQAISNETGAYYKLADGAKAALDAKKRELILSAYEDPYRNAIKTRTSAYEALTKAIQAQGEAQSEVDRIQSELAEASPAQWDALNIKLARAQQQLETLTGETQVAQSSWQKFNDTIVTFETAQATEDMTIFNGIVSQLSSALVKGTGENKAALEASVVDRKKNLDMLVAITADAWVGMTDAQKRQASEQLAEQKDLLNQQITEAKTAGVELPAEFADGITLSSPLYSESMRGMLKSTYADLEAAGYDMKKFGSSYDLLIAAGVLEGKESPKSAFETLFAEGLVTMQAKAKEMQALGKAVPEGFAKGMLDSAWMVSNAAFQLANIPLPITRSVLKVNSPSKEFIAMGLSVTEGFSLGMDKGKGEVVKSAAELSKAVLQAATDWVEERQFYQESTAENELALWKELRKNAALQAEELAKIDRNIYKARQEASKESFEHSKKWIEQETFYQRLSAEETVEAWERVVDRKNLLNDQQLEAEKSLFTARRNLLKEQESAEKKLADTEKKLADEQKKRVDDYEKTRSARVDSLRSFAGLFSEVDKKTEVSGKELLKNLEDQVKLFEGWQADMVTLAGKDDMSEALLAELREMGPKAAAEIHAMANMSDDTLKEYVGNFSKLGGMIQDQVNKEIPPIKIPIAFNTSALNVALLGMDGQGQTMAKTAANLLGVFCTAIRGTDGVLRLSGLQSVDALSLGMQDNNVLLQERTSGLMQNSLGTTQRFSSHFRTAGEYLMQGVAQGISDGRSGLINTIIWTLQAAVAAAREEMEINSPSKVWARIGSYMAQGLGSGFTEEMQGVSRKIRSAIPAPTIETDGFSRLGEGIVNGVAQAAQFGSGNTQPIVLQINLDSKLVARQTFDPLLAFAKQRGVSFG